MSVAKTSNLLRDRFKNNGRPQISLKSNQRKAIADFKAQTWTYVDLKCHVCDSTDFLPVSEKDRYGIDYFTGLCKRCGNLQQSRYYNEDGVHRFYSEFYRHIYGGNTPEILFSIQQTEVGPRVYNFVKDKIKPGSSILEIGCGAGGIMKYFQDQGHNVQGIDLDESFLEYGRSKGVKLTNSWIQSFTTDTKFDLVVLSHVLEHFVDPGRELEKIRTLLKDDGQLYIEVPSLHIVRREYNADLLTYFQNAHVTHFTVASLQNLLTRHGFERVAHNDFIQSISKVAPLQPVTPANKFDETQSELEAIEKQYDKQKLKNNVKWLMSSGLDFFGIDARFKTRIKKLIKR